MARVCCRHAPSPLCVGTLVETVSIVWEIFICEGGSSHVRVDIHMSGWILICQGGYSYEFIDK